MQYMYVLRAMVTCDSAPQYGNTILHAAVLNEQPHILRSLLVKLRCQQDSNSIAEVLNRQNQDGHTVLHVAATEGYKVSRVQQRG